MEGPGDISAPTFNCYFGKGSGSKTTRRSSKATKQEEGEAVNTAKVLNVMVQIAREPPDRVEEATEAPGKRDIDPAQGQQRQEEQGGRLRRYSTNEQYKVCREEAACLRQRINLLEGITDAMEDGSIVMSQASPAQQRAAER